MEYIRQQDQSRRDIYASSRDASRAQPFTNNISNRLTDHARIDYSRTATEAEREIIYKAMMGSIMVHDPSYFRSFYQSTSKDVRFQSHFEALKEINDSIRILWKGVKQKNYIRKTDQVTLLGAREDLLTKHFVKWFYEALESYQPDMYNDYITPISALKGKIISPAVVNAPLSSDIHQIIGVKPLERRDGNVTDVYFVLEKLTNETINRWQTYGDNAFPPRGKNGGNEGFRESLTYYGRTDTWVAYAASKNPKIEELVMGTGVSLDKKSHIEMVFCVHMNENCPVTTHMGIYRPYASQEMVNGDVVMRHDCHKNLSVELHGFAAKVSRLMKGKKHIMVTRPLKVMGDILVRNFADKPNQIWTGDEYERSKARKEINNKLTGIQTSEWSKYISKEDILEKFIPKIEEPGILESMSDELCKLNVEGQQILFPRPNWFDHNCVIRGGGSSPLTMISLKAMADKW
ncbi:hypothetical protein [Candidatus Finniella inopinata]|uniref:hypothetical protein n=1 Tax=Candidatus Finniella inopinata TaxID=1696036 RepID=UPI0013EEB6E7|nr:hypothetical protein [Candidatus Finniella inopinata]